MSDNMFEQYVNSEECLSNALALVTEDWEAGGEEGEGETALIWHDLAYEACPECGDTMTVEMPDAMGNTHTACMECGWVDV